MRSVLLLLAGMAMFGCGTGTKSLPAAGGGQGEVLVVMPTAYWEGEPGATLRSILEQPVERLPQREARFSVAHVPPEGFGSLLSVHHSVVLAAIGPEADTDRVEFLRDRHARGQVLLQVSAKDPVEWIRMVQQNGEDIVRTLEDQQRRIVIHRLAKERDLELVAKLKEVHHLSMDIPGGYRVMKQTADFTWLQRDRIMSGSGLDHNVIEGFLVHTHPYTSDSTFTVGFLMDQRDSVTRMHVEGPNPGTYMRVQRSFEELDLRPTSRALEHNGLYALLMHGLYGMQGAKMGGPFVSLTTVDEERKRVVTVEGFAYAPQFNKREYVRELEAVLFTLQIIPPASP